MLETFHHVSHCSVRFQNFPPSRSQVSFGDRVISRFLGKSSVIRKRADGLTKNYANEWSLSDLMFSDVCLLTY